MQEEKRLARMDFSGEDYAALRLYNDMLNDFDKKDELLGDVTADFTLSSQNEGNKGMTKAPYFQKM